MLIQILDTILIILSVIITIGIMWIFVSAPARRMAAIEKRLDAIEEERVLLDKEQIT